MRVHNNYVVESQGHSRHLAHLLYTHNYTSSITGTDTTNYQEQYTLDATKGLYYLVSPALSTDENISSYTSYHSQTPATNAAHQLANRKT